MFGFEFTNVFRICCVCVSCFVSGFVFFVCLVFCCVVFLVDFVVYFNVLIDILICYYEYFRMNCILVVYAPSYYFPPRSPSQVRGAPRPVPPSPFPFPSLFNQNGCHILLAIASSPWASALIGHIVFGLILLRTGILLFVVVDLNLKLGWGCKRRWTGGGGAGAVSM